MLLPGLRVFWKMILRHSHSVFLNLAGPQGRASAVDSLPYHGEGGLPVEQAAQRRRSLILCGDSLQQVSPEGRCDPVALEPVPCAVRQLIYLALLVDAVFAPVIRHTLQALAIAIQAGLIV